MENVGKMEWGSGVTVGTETGNMGLENISCDWRMDANCTLMVAISAFNSMISHFKSGAGETGREGGDWGPEGHGSCVTFSCTGGGRDLS